MNEDARNIAGSIHTGTFYIDPARRADDNKRVFALTDCEPDVLQLKPLLLGSSQRLIVKISPMADIDETLRLLPETVEVHILSVRNAEEECPVFPGRKFTTGEVFEFSGKLLKQLRKTIPQANITTRNFNLSVEELRKRTGIKEGGDIYLLATTKS